jgi:hypothetical protein
MSGTDLQELLQQGVGSMCALSFGKSVCKSELDQVELPPFKGEGAPEREWVLHQFTHL